MCYELIENIAVMISDIEMGTVGGEVVATGGGKAPSQQPQQQPQQQPRPSPPGQGMPPSAIDELKDMGVPATFLLFPSPYKGPTPNQINRAKLITTGDLVGMIKNDSNLLIVDTSGLRDTLPIGYPLADAGSDGSVTDQLQSALDAWLLKKANNNRRAAVVFVGASMNDRSSYNAALRAGSLGWTAYWYRGGVEAWVANGLPTTADMAKKN
ncbi:hypothetical protein G6F35_013986 [Rhizopus arrhizus]|nr:hypothetical protein G6F35_013986 [Rhizopus arrhizus]